MSAKFKFIHDYPLFSGLADEQMQAVMQICREECFIPDTILFEEGQPAEEIFVLVEGKVEESFTKDEATITLLRPVDEGEIIGCSALIHPCTNSCTARSLGNIEVLAIDAMGLQELFARDCLIARTIQQHVIEALLKRMGKMQAALFLPLQ